MRRQKQSSTPSDESDIISSGPVMRTTVFLTDALNGNLDALALKTGVPKGEHVRRAITQYMQDLGLKPDKKPKITVSY